MSQTSYYAGFGRVRITPTVGCELAGQFLPRFATAIHDELYARAMAVSDGAACHVLLSCDLAAVPASTVGAARALIARETGLRAEDCDIFATETHTGPRAHDSLGRSADPAIRAVLPGQLCEAARMAYGNLQQAQLVVATSALHATYNRRFLMRGGRAVMNPPHGHPDVLCPEGPTDPQVHVLAALDDSGRWLGAMVNWASHPIVVGHESVISADYPGAMEAFLRRTLDPEFVCLFANGASGDLYPFDWYNPERTPYGFVFMERLGRALGAEVVKALSLEVRSMDHRRLQSARRLLTVGLREPQARGADEDVLPPEVADVYAADRRLLEREREKSAIEIVEVGCLGLGDCLMFVHPAELFCSLGLEIKARTAGWRTMVIGRAGGYVGYVPSEQAFAGGGYETVLCRTSKLVPAAGRMLVEACAALAAEMPR